MPCIVFKAYFSLKFQVTDSEHHFIDNFYHFSVVTLQKIPLNLVKYTLVITIRNELLYCVCQNATQKCYYFNCDNHSNGHR